jgi:hypothetical protein
VELGIIVFDFALALVIGWQLQNVPFNSLCATAPVHVAATRHPGWEVYWHLPLGGC